ncbi:MAG: S8 family serine peptidase [Myxococcaceae bacterium]|nr:S8 family serine peptidase [Myxococcaceae bacterium]
MRRLLTSAVAVLVLGCGEALLPVSLDGKIAPEVVTQVRVGPTLALVEVELPSSSTAQPLVSGDDDRSPTQVQLDARKDAIRALLSEPVEATLYRHLPVLALVLDTEADLVRLGTSPMVKRVHANAAYELALTQSLALINQPAALAAGHRGEGATVAVLDTGLDYTRAAFGSCTAPGSPGTCRVPFVQDFAPTDNALDDHGHGTNVAGIVLGVAPGARVLGLDVFSGGLAYSNHILAAIDWCIQNRTTYNIVALNMSLGGGSASAPCSTDVFASSVAAAKSAGILSAVATGNNGYTSSISSPACVPAAVSVGAVYDSNLGSLSWSTCTDAVTAADRVTCFSNSASFITLVAPGSSITAAGITMSGTSQATPHVAGGIAVLAAAFPADSVEERLQRLVTSGSTVVDHRNGVAKPRLDLSTVVAGGCVYAVSPTSASVGANGGPASFTISTGASCAWTASSAVGWVSLQASGTGPATVTATVAPNTGGARAATLVIAGRSVTMNQAAGSTAPSGSVTIQGGAEAIRTTAVTLTLSATDDGQVTSMCLTNTTTCSSWKTYATSSAWTLTSGSGIKTVRVFFRDEAGNVSPAASDTIVLDSTPPTNGTVTAAGGDAQVALSWAGFSDALSGLASYKVVSQANTAPASCSVGSVLYTGTATSFVHTPLSNGLTFGYRVCALDAAGNVSTGVAVTARAAPEFVPPTGTVRINDDAAWAKSTSALLSLSASDASGVAQLCASNTATCTAWQSFSPLVAFTLTAGSGLRTVRVWFKDRWGNVSEPASDTISLDTAPPTAGTVSVVRGDARIDLVWSGFADATSGVASYSVVMNVNGAPPNCTTGTVLASNITASTLSQTGLTNGTTYGFRVCARDVAGNLSTGVATTGMPAPEFVGPTGTASIVGGATVTGSASVTLALTATDASPITSMCLSNTTTCTAWVAYMTTKTWTLASGSGLKTVRVWFRDVYGNVSPTPATASITLDTTAPAGGTFTATPGPGSVTLTWSGITDAHSGVASYRVVWKPGTTVPSCAAGVVLTSTTGTSFSHTGLAPGAAVTYRLCATDAVGNTSAGLVKTATPQ